MKNPRTNIAGLLLVLATVLGSGLVVDIPAGAKPWLALASSLLMAVGLFLAKDAAPPSAPPSDGASPKVPPVVIGALSVFVGVLVFIGCGGLR